MAYRHRVPKSVDRRIVRNSTSKSRLINVKPLIYRGGIRL